MLPRRTRWNRPDDDDGNQRRLVPDRRAPSARPLFLAADAPLIMPAVRPSGMIRRLLRAPVWLYRWKCGWLLGHRFLLVIHTGRRTRLRRCTVLEVIEFRKAACEAVVISASGRNADWLRNIEDTRSGFEIVIGARRFAATHRVLDTGEATSVIAGYERRNRRIAPIVRAGLSWLLGWRYDGSEQARARAAAQLPLIAFRPLRSGDGAEFRSLPANPDKARRIP